VGILWQDSRKAANFDIKSCNYLRHARFSQQVCWDVTMCHCWACSSDVSIARLLDRTALSDHEDGGNIIGRSVGTTRPRPETRRHIAHCRNLHHLVLQARPLALSTTLPEPQKTRYQLKNTIYILFLWHVHTCSNVHPNYKTANGAFRDAVRNFCQDVLYFQNGMRFRGTCVLRFTSTRNARPSLRRFSRSAKTYNITLHRMSATSDNANRNSFMSLSMTVTCDFHETHCYTALHENLTNGLATDTSQTRRMGYSHDILFTA